MRVQVKDFMSAPVKTVAIDDKLETVRSKFKNNNFHSLPVVEYEVGIPVNKAIIRGIITQSNLKKSISDDTLAKDVMTTNVHVLHPDSSAASAARMMLKKDVHHLVVMEDGDIIGMVSSLDFVKLVAEHSLE